MALFKLIVFVEHPRASRVKGKGGIEGGQHSFSKSPSFCWITSVTYFQDFNFSKIHRLIRHLKYRNVLKNHCSKHGC
ncbi:hypothetical protein HYFRA_00007182 [Hymenoscyphus fraxineus]|uniref:Uncharacterized protein n=1 Tax=Hymenoscyphus fraxineus TaxID=746836 RepID=A0A9N9KWI8_9HELO|nr:hypothetical protein HYFRA_00007182 [Hymenoscyphus fraxineus]